MRTKNFSFGVAVLEYDPGPDEELRGVLQRWADLFRNDHFTNDARSKGVEAWSVDYADVARNVDELAGRLSTVLANLRTL